MSTSPFFRKPQPCNPSLPSARTQASGSMQGSHHHSQTDLQQPHMESGHAGPHTETLPDPKGRRAEGGGPRAPVQSAGHPPLSLRRTSSASGSRSGGVARKGGAQQQVDRGGRGHDGRVCMCVCVSVCTHACGRARARVCVCVRASVHVRLSVGWASSR